MVEILMLLKLISCYHSPRRKRQQGGGVVDAEFYLGHVEFAVGMTGRGKVNPGRKAWWEFIWTGLQLRTHLGDIRSLSGR